MVSCNSAATPVRSDPGGQGNRCGAPVGGEVAEQDRLGRRCCVGHVRVDHYRTTENRKVAFGTEPVDQILSVDFNDSGPLQALFYGAFMAQRFSPQPILLSIELGGSSHPVVFRRPPVHEPLGFAELLPNLCRTALKRPDRGTGRMLQTRGRATLTLPEAAHVLGISRSTAHELARTGKLPVLGETVGNQDLSHPPCGPPFSAGAVVLLQLRRRSGGRVPVVAARDCALYPLSERGPR